MSEIIVSSDRISKLDIDVLLEKLRKTYDIAISYEETRGEFVFQTPIIEIKEEKDNEEAFIEEVEKKIIVEVEQELEEEPTIIENKAPAKQIIIEPEILFDTEPVKTPSVLKYLNEQMPKQKEVSQMFDRKEPEMVLDKPIIEPLQEEEKDSIEAEEVAGDIEPLKPNKTVENNQNSKTIGENYSQNKSVFDNISNTVNKNDVSSRFKSNDLDLRRAIGVNEKFMFINDLFSGNLREYTEFIQVLNSEKSLEEANIIIANAKEANNWNANSLAFTTLYEILIKKFR
ncbi:MAG: hypothetical protein WC135_09785 [Bacteroidales bacterium]